MSWIHEKQRLWRPVALLLLLVAIAGPWGFDRIHVPSPYPCSAPYVRLDENFCGRPLSLAWTLQGGSFSNLGSMLRSLATYPLTALIFLPLLPFISTMLLLLPGERRHARAMQVVVLGLVGVGILALLLLPPWRGHWALWGIWLYSGVIAALLLLEILALRQRRPAARE
jgi:hypothetical protein